MEISQEGTGDRGEDMQQRTTVGQDSNPGRRGKNRALTVRAPPGEPPGRLRHEHDWISYQ